MRSFEPSLRLKTRRPVSGCDRNGRAVSGQRSISRHRVIQIALLFCFSALTWSASADPVADFDMANRLYGQGKYSEAAAAYEKLAQNGIRSEALFFDLGNARFKAGEIGLAIAAWREAERISPRDPSVRFNLQFARRQVGGSEFSSGSIWQRALTALTLNEWAVLTSIALWLWFVLLALREFRPGLRRTLRGYTASAAAVMLFLAVCLGAAASAQLNTVSAVVIVPEALGRQSPWEEAQVVQHFRDGTEVTVVDEIRRLSGEADQTWFQVRDNVGRVGWVKKEHLAVIGGRQS
jgi:tetratricopeptide (TPR) repeat protein